MSLFGSYRPGELSLLLNPSTDPDVFVPTKVTPSNHSKADKREKYELKEENSDDDSSEDEEQLEQEEDEDEFQFESDEEADNADQVDDSVIVDDSSAVDSSVKRRLLKARLNREDREEEAHDIGRGEKNRNQKQNPKDDPRLSRTLFLGNLSVTTDKKSLLKLVKPFGSVESIRLRSFSKSNPKMPPKAAILQKKFHSEKDSLNAYIVFNNENDRNSALKLNGIKWCEKILRADKAEGDGKTDPRKSIFIGNLPFNAQEEEVRDAFKDIGKISFVRLVRDTGTSIGKGFGYVEFQESKAVKLALALHGMEFKGRKLRLSRVASEFEITKIKKKKEEQTNKAKNPSVNGQEQKKTKEKHLKRKLEQTNNQGNQGENKRQKSEKSSRAFQGEQSSEKEHLKKMKLIEKSKKKKKLERKSNSQKSLVKQHSRKSKENDQTKSKKQDKE
jgi:nucleolar protein 12